MANWRQIKNNQKNIIILDQAKWCTGFFSKLRGFMFQQSINPEEGLVFVYRHDNRINMSIHMFFVPFDLGVIWVNDAGNVVDKVRAKSWRPKYAPKDPARYVIELHPDKLALVNIGDKLNFLTNEQKQ